MGGFIPCLLIVAAIREAGAAPPAPEGQLLRLVNLGVRRLVAAVWKTGPMELAQAGQLLGAFLGGGFGGAYLESLWADRNARRVALRPKDMPHIEAARIHCRRVFDHVVAKALGLRFMGDSSIPTPELFEDSGEYHMIQELNNRKLDACWQEFLDGVVLALDQYPAPISKQQEREVYKTFEGTPNKMLQRLNELERSR